MSWPFSNDYSAIFGTPTGDQRGFGRVTFPAFYYNWAPLPDADYETQRIVAPWTGITSIDITVNITASASFPSDSSSASCSFSETWTFLPDLTKDQQTADDEDKFHYIDHFATTRFAHFYAPILGSTKTITIGGQTADYFVASDTLEDTFDPERSASPAGRYLVRGSVVPIDVSSWNTSERAIYNVIEFNDTSIAIANMNEPASGPHGGTETGPISGGSFTKSWSITFNY